MVVGVLPLRLCVDGNTYQNQSTTATRALVRWNLPCVVGSIRFFPFPRGFRELRQITHHLNETTYLVDIQVSFRDAVWPDLKDPSLADKLWGSEVHPSWQVHQLLADVLVYYIEKSYARFLEVSASTGKQNKTRVIV